MLNIATITEALSSTIPVCRRYHVHCDQKHTLASTPAFPILPQLIYQHPCRLEPSLCSHPVSRRLPSWSIHHSETAPRSTPRIYVYKTTPATPITAARPSIAPETSTPLAPATGILVLVGPAPVELAMVAMAVVVVAPAVLVGVGTAAMVCKSTGVVE